MQAAL
jgi:hypothetical protein